MHKRIVSLLIIIASSLLLCACLNNKDVTVNTNDVVSLEEEGVTESTNAFKTSGFSQHVKFSYTDQLPILLKGDLYGYVTVNQLEKVNFADWHNATAVANGMNFSYSLNMTIKLAKGVSIESMDIVPALCDEKGNIFSDTCNVGWTGFPSRALFYTNTDATTVEIGFQPRNQFDISTMLLKLMISIGKNRCEDIIIKPSIFSAAVEGPSIHNSEEEVTVSSINGASYCVNVSDVYYEKDHLPADSDSDAEEHSIDYRFKIAYLQPPSNDRVVASFDSQNSNSLNTFVVTAVMPDCDSKSYYDSSPNSQRKLFADDNSDYGRYVPTKEELSDILPGNYVKYFLNRVVTFPSDPKYVRFSFEFPAEASARSTEELLAFNGRFLVFENPVTERKLQYEEEYNKENEEKNEE